jgi:hypothetical protein
LDLALVSCSDRYGAWIGIPAQKPIMCAAELTSHMMTELCAWRLLTPTGVAVERIAMIPWENMSAEVAYFRKCGFPVSQEGTCPPLHGRAQVGRHALGHLPAMVARPLVESWRDMLGRDVRYAPNPVEPPGVPRSTDRRGKRGGDAWQDPRPLISASQRVAWWPPCASGCRCQYGARSTAERFTALIDQRVRA